jgi:hypothetical protein
MVSGLVAFRKNMDGGGAGIEALLAHAAQQVAHGHGDIAEVDIDRAGRQHLWHTVQ